MFLPAIRETCKASGADLTVFAGGTLLEPFTFDYHMNSIYSYINPENVDVMIILSATLRSYVAPAVFTSFFDSISKIPIISITLQLENHYSLIIDNKTGLEKAIRHLVLDHQKKRIAFIKGPENNFEAKQRLDVFYATLRDCGIEPDPLLVCPGDFTGRTGTKAVSILLDERKASFDAIVSANDEMALSAMHALQDRGISIPDDVAIVGFDDLIQTAYMSPSLTTVRQPFYEQGKLAVEMALGIINGIPMEPLQVSPTELVIRSSCGCLPRSIDLYTSTRELIAANIQPLHDINLEDCLEQIRKLACPQELTGEELIDGVSYLYSLFSHVSSLEQNEKAFLRGIQNFTVTRNQDLPLLLFWEQVITVIAAYLGSGKQQERFIIDAGEKACILLHEAQVFIQNRLQYKFIDESIRFQRIIELFLLTKDLAGLNSVLTQIMPVLDIRNFFLVLHKTVKNKSDKPLPDIVSGRKLVLAIRNGQPLDITPLKVEDRLLLPKSIMDSMQDYQLTVSAVLSREELFGYVCMECGGMSVNIYDSLILELGGVVKRCLLDYQQKRTENKLREALMKLKELNQKLADLSHTDELTGLYNRRGFMDMAEHSLVLAHRMKKDALMIFIDLDGLKKINDTWGHCAGDAAIKGASLVLKATFRQVDIISRLGGDEFIILTLDSPNSTKDIMLNRLFNNIGTFNNSNTNSWELSMSIGVLPVTWEEKRPLTELMQIADRLQYEDKMAKKKARQ